MSPFIFFSIALGLTVAASVAERVMRRLHRQRLRRLAGEWRMTYSPTDEFRLTPRVVRAFPVPGAAKIRVVDLIYGIDSDQYRYVFTAEYTVGVVGNKRRILRAATLSEPRDRADATAPIQMTMVPVGLPLLEQYRTLQPVPAAVPAGNS